MRTLTNNSCLITNSPYILYHPYIIMTFQFKTRPRDNPHEECEREMGLLKEYTKALEKENESRNEERKALQAEIERLLRH